jgi:sulfatase maturation enzyme AslB (radical SAM superfamily)
MKVKSCWLIEGGMAYRPHWIGGCCTSTAIAPFFYEGAELEEIKKGRVPRLEEIVAKRRQLFEKANDPNSGIPCLQCGYLVEKDMDEVSFDKLRYIDLQHYTTCNNRCTYCYYAQRDLFVPPQYDVLRHIDVFAKSGNVSKDCIVLFNGGEPALLKDFGQYVDYFRGNGIQVELYTNGTRFNESIYSHIARGNIIRTNISVDAGTAATYKAIHKSDKYDAAIENIARYSEAAQRSGTLIQAKYIFLEENSNQEDVRGFVHAMLAVRPQVVLLTMNFEHLTVAPLTNPNSQARHTYNEEVEGYANMYVLFKKFGWEVNHLMHYITIIEPGKRLVERVMARICELEKQTTPDPRAALRTFRSTPPLPTPPTPQSTPLPRRMADKVQWLLPHGSHRRALAAKAWHVAHDLVRGQRK